MQNNNRLILWLLLGFVVYLIYGQWTEANKPVEEVAQIETVNGQNLNNAKGNNGNVSVPTASTETGDSASVPSVGSGAMYVDQDSIVHVKTDVYNIKIDLNGGDIYEVGLPKHPISVEEPDSQFLLMAANNERYLITQTGLISPQGQPVAPNHSNSRFVAEQSEFVMADDETLVVPLTYIDKENHLTVVKRYTFHKGKYHIGFEQEVINQSDSAWMGQEYRQLLESPSTQKKRGFGASSYKGAVFSLPEDNYKYEKIPFKKMTEQLRSYEGTGGWISLIEQYFVVAWVSSGNSDAELNSENKNIIQAVKLKDENKYLIRMLDKNNVTIQPGESFTFKSRLFAGPKYKDQLAETADKLELTLDYGWFSPISNIMLWLLKFYHSFIGNWGWSIVLLTCTVKLALVYFANKGYVSMARMRHVGPQLELIREQYSEDRQKLSEEMMKLYRREKINPLGGCWPILIQIPIFISLFWMLQESVELRQAEWIFWIKDLSKMDPYFVMPLIMGATMFFQQRLNPTPPDPMQAKIIKWMPVVFTFMFMWFASGIVLYWIVNNLLTILQQTIIMRRVEGKTAKKA